MESKNELTITRVFDAPRERVWKAWTEPEMFKKWWVPKDFTCPVSQIDFRVGGKYLHCMHGSDSLPPEIAGKDFWSTGTYKEIVPMEKIVVLDSFADKKGNKVPSSHYGMEGFPDQMQVTVVFEEQDSPLTSLRTRKTKMTLKHAGIEGVGKRDVDNMEQGWNQSFDKLAQSLKGGE